MSSPNPFCLRTTQKSSTNKSYWQVQVDLHAVKTWMKKKQNGVSYENGIFCGHANQEQRSCLLNKQKALELSKYAKDLGVNVQEDLSWKIHVGFRLKKANKIRLLDTAKRCCTRSCKNNF